MAETNVVDMLTEKLGIVKFFKTLGLRAENGEFKNAFVIAVRKDGTVECHGTRVENEIEQIGMLEMAKWERLYAGQK